MIVPFSLALDWEDSLDRNLGRLPPHDKGPLSSLFSLSTLSLLSLLSHTLLILEVEALLSPPFRYRLLAAVCSRLCTLSSIPSKLPPHRETTKRSGFFKEGVSSPLMMMPPMCSVRDNPLLKDNKQFHEMYKCFSSVCRFAFFWVSALNCVSYSSVPRILLHQEQ